MSQPGDPIEGDVLVRVAATASVPPQRLVPLIDRVQETLDEECESLRRRYETAYEDDEEGTIGLFVDEEFWNRVGDRLGLTDRERDAVERAHNQQLRAVGKRHDRLDEFETALEIRDCVVLES